MLLVYIFCVYLFFLSWILLAHVVVVVTSHPMAYILPSLVWPVIGTMPQCLGLFECFQWYALLQFQDRLYSSENNIMETCQQQLCIGKPQAERQRQYFCNFIADDNPTYIVHTWVRVPMNTDRSPTRNELPIECCFLFHSPTLTQKDNIY